MELDKVTALLDLKLLKLLRQGEGLSYLAIAESASNVHAAFNNVTKVIS